MSAIGSAIFIAIILIVIFVLAGAKRLSRENYVPDNVRYRANDQAYFNIPEKSLVEQGIIPAPSGSAHPTKTRDYYPGRGVLGQIFFT